MSVDMRTIEFIKAKLQELQALSEAQGTDMLTYLLGMSMTEADDVLSGLRPISSEERPTLPLS